MAGYTKTDFDSLYSIRLRIWDEAIKGYRRSPIRLHYHRAVIYQDFIKPKWAAIVNKLGITSSDRVAIIGAGFGWGVEEVISLTGCIAVGVDISDYIDATKNSTEETEIDAAIIASGYDPLIGHGLEAKNYAYAGDLKAKQVLLKENIAAVKGKNAIKSALGNKLPTWVITEDMLSDWTDADISVFVTGVNKLDVSVCHVIRENYLINPRTIAEWQTLTGHTIIRIGDFERFG